MGGEILELPSEKFKRELAEKYENTIADKDAEIEKVKADKDAEKMEKTPYFREQMEKNKREDFNAVQHA